MKSQQEYNEQVRDMAKRIKWFATAHPSEPLVVQWNCSKEIAQHSTVSHAITHDLIIVSPPARTMIGQLVEYYGARLEPTTIMLREAMNIAYPTQPN